MAEQPRKVVVVLGDWFIDENWVVSRRYSPTSSHTGDRHYVSNHPSPMKRMINLCGAGEVLEVLVRRFRDSFLFRGYGAWNPQDDIGGNLKCALCSNAKLQESIHQRFTPYSINGLLQVGEDNECPYKVAAHEAGSWPEDTQCDYLKGTQEILKLKNVWRPSNPEQKAETGTSRIYRVYEGYGSGKPRLLYRFDWELDISNDKIEHGFKELNGCEIAAVIIVDHGKGVVCPTIVESLKKAVGDSVPWYVRSKLEDPPWRESFRGKASLRVVDFKIASRDKGPRRVHRAGHLTRAGLELLGDLTKHKLVEGSAAADARRGGQEPLRETLESERAAVLLDDNSAIAKDGDNCYVLTSPTAERELFTIGRTTIFFTALIAQDLDDKPNFGVACRRALECARTWSEESTAAWSGDQPRLHGSYEMALDSLPQESPRQPAGLGSSTPVLRREAPPQGFKDSWLRWALSSQDLGIIENLQESPTTSVGSDAGGCRAPTLQLWRGRGAIEGFVNVGGPKRDQINRLVLSMSLYLAEAEARHPFNCMLIAAPGWGKSFLARGLAKLFGLRYLEVSIAQMATSDDLVDYLDTIRSVQDATSEKLLIFVDEVNSQIQGHSALGLLLGPVWDGGFVRDGKPYTLDPSLWVFASTDRLPELMNVNKGSDFVSRLNGPVVELDAVDDKRVDADKKKKFFDELAHLRKSRAISPEYLPESWADLHRDYEDIVGESIMTEQVYLCVTLLEREWGHVRQVDGRVLKLFRDLIPLNGIRSLQFFISRFHGVDRGVVSFSCVPSLETEKELGRHIILPPDDQCDGSTRMIEIEERPRKLARADAT